jgi:hypothetical protein
MMSIKTNEAQRYTPSMCHLSRALREKNEGRGEQGYSFFVDGCFVARIMRVTPEDITQFFFSFEPSKDADDNTRSALLFFSGTLQCATDSGNRSHRPPHRKCRRQVLQGRLSLFGCFLVFFEHQFDSHFNSHFNCDVL